MKDLQFKFYHKQIDHPYVQQYFALREVEYKKKLKLKKFSGSQDKHDEDSHILIASIGNEVIGGMRLVISDYGKTKLPLESDSFRLKDLFPKMNLQNCKYAEISRFAVRSEFRSARLAEKICNKIFLDKLFQLHVSYGFCVSSVDISRAAILLCKKIGLDMQVKKDIKIPNLDVYENLEMYLSIIDLNHLYDKRGVNTIQTA